MKNYILFMLLAVASIGAYAQTLIDGRLILPQLTKFTVVSAQGEVMLQSSGNEVTGAYLRDGIYIVHSDFPWVRISVANFRITGMSYRKKVASEDEEEKADTTITICFFPIVPLVQPSTEVMNRDPRRLRGDFYIYAFIFAGDTLQPYTNDDDIYFPEWGEYEKPDWNIRLSIKKNWNSRIYAPSVTSFPAADTNSTVAWCKYSFSVTTGLHTFIPRDTGTIMSVLVDHVFTRTDSVVITSDGVARDAIILSDASTQARMVLCRYVPDFTVPCDPTPPEPKPYTGDQFKQLIASYGVMENQMDTLLQARQAVYYTQPFTGNALRADHEADIYSVPFDFILNLYSNDWGGICGNYATFYRRTLNELYGIRAWEYSIGILGTNVGGHMQTLVEHVGPSVSYVTHMSRDTSYYVDDADFNCMYMDSLGNPMDIRDQFLLIAAHRQREIYVTENSKVGTFFQKGPCLRTTGTGVYTPDSYVEEPGTGYLYRHHLVRRIEGLALDPEYVDISMWYENLESQGYQYRGDFADWPMSVIWFKGLFGGPDYQNMTTRVYGWMHDAGLDQ